MKEKKEEEGWWRFLAVCSAVSGSKDMNEFFDLFLTNEERRAMAGRFLIVEALLKGEQNQRDLARDLEVSISKITRGSNSLKTISNKLRTFLREKMG